MKEIIETSKGRFVVTDDLDKINNWINNGKYEYICMLKRCEEKEASSIVDYPIVLEEIQGGGEMYTYYNYKIGRYDYGSSLIDSLESLLESQGIEITNNTYIFKV